MKEKPSFWRSAPVIGAGAAVVSVVVAELWLGRLGRAPELLLFLGRFHPLLVHLPIGMFVLAVLAELGSASARLRGRIEPALGLLLSALLASAVGAFVLGQLLANDGGFPAGALLWHRRLTLVAVTGAALALVAFARHARDGSRSARQVYRVLLFASFAVLSLGAHFGGTMTRGEAYLAKYAPGPLKPLLGASREPMSAAPKPKPAAVAEPLVFENVVLPLLREHCSECHGAEKTKGALRLDSLEAIRKGGESGAALVPGSSGDSSMLTRMRLPMDDDERMPPDGEPGPNPDEIALIAFWIDRGASATLAVRDALAPDGARAVLQKAAEGSAAPPRSNPSAAVREKPGHAAPKPAQPEPNAHDKAATSEPTPRGAAEPASEIAPAPADESSSPPAAAPSSASGASALLSEKCEKCHGAAKQKGKLRVDSLAALLRGGKAGPAIVPGEPEKSPLIRRLRLPLGDDEHMPPRKEPQLDAREIAVLVRWIENQSSAANRDSEPATGATAERAADSSSSEAPAAADASDPADVSAPEAAPSEAVEATLAGVKQSSATASTPADPELVARLPEKLALFRDLVLPVLLERCGNCHAGAKRSAGLRVESHAELVAGGDSGPGIVAGKPEESLILQRMRLPVSDMDHMPPKALPQATPGEIELIHTWIARGAREDTLVETRSLPAAAVVAAVDRHPAAKESASTLSANAGCAACSVGAERSVPLGAWALAASLALTLGLRRRAARPSAESRPIVRKDSLRDVHIASP